MGRTVNGKWLLLERVPCKSVPVKRLGRRGVNSWMCCQGDIYMYFNIGELIDILIRRSLQGGGFRK